MTVISLVHANIIHSQSSISKEGCSKQAKTRKLLVVFLLSGILLVGLFYVLQVNSITSNGYQIRNLKKQQVELEDKTNTLEITISDLKSVNFLESKTESFGMVKAQNIEYLAIPPVDVATVR